MVAQLPHAAGRQRSSRLIRSAQGRPGSSGQDATTYGTRSAHLTGMNPEKPTPHDPNQGEGDRGSARRYNQEVREFVAGGKVEPAGNEAETYVTQQPEDAARAERRAKRGPRSTRTSLDELVAQGRTVVDRVRPIVDRAVGRLRARFGRK